MKTLPLLLLFVWIVFPAKARADYPALPVAGCPAQTQFNLDHFSAVDGLPGLFRGGKPAQTGIECLKSAGVNAIVDLRSEGETSRSSEESWAREAGIRYFAFPMTTDESVPSAACRSRGETAVQCNQSALLAAVQLLKQLLADGVSEGVFVHCARGEDRTGLVLGTYRLQEQGPSQGWTKARARQEMREYGYSPYPSLQSIWDAL